VTRAALRQRFTFKDKVVVITGGSRGLGLEMARVFGRKGARIALIARNAATLEAAIIELERSGVHAMAIPCDVRDESEVQAAIGSVASRFGRIDVLVNNAGIIQVGPFEQMTTADFENAMATHVWGALNAIRAVLPEMRRNGGGRIVNISSIGGKIGVPHMLPYVVSKFALAGLSRGLSNEIRSEGIRVTTVYPGLMRTGSHVNASFKGNYRKEFAWFSMAASFPIVSVNAARAARQIIEACRRGKAELIITPTARLAAMAGAIAPEAMDRGMQLFDRLLPEPAPENRDTARSGWESQSQWSPSFFTTLADRAIERNNERLPAD
jgi:NAD(P)-dependent dehydrogenase (short-subunit alcohol dehydrogenase family)